MPIIGNKKKYLEADPINNLKLENFTVFILSR